MRAVNLTPIAFTLSLALGVCPTSTAQTLDSDEAARPTAPSEQYRRDAPDIGRFLREHDFAAKLLAPSFGAASREQLDARRRLIQAATPIPGIAPGDRGVVYDVILQPGHYGRTTGATGTGGKEISERALVAYVARQIADRLRGQGLKVLVISADAYLKDDPRTPAFDGLRTRVFLSIHADGSIRPCTTGPSLAYAEKSSTYAMYAIGWGLTKALGYSYDDFRKDGFTPNEAKYYMFRQVRASELSGLLELGELTCADAENNLIANAPAAAANVAHAISFILTVPYEAPK